MAESEPQLVIAFVCGLGALLLILLWPGLAFYLVLTIPAFKGPLRHVAPGIMQSFTYDMAVTLLALVGAVRHRLVRFPESRFPLPVGFLVCWAVLTAMVWLRLPASRAPEYGMKKSLDLHGFRLACLPDRGGLRWRPAARPDHRGHDLCCFSWNWRIGPFELHL